MTYTEVYKWPLLGSMLALLVAGAIEGAFPIYMEYLIRWLFETKEPSMRLIGPIGVVVFFAASAIAGFIGNYGTQYVGHRVILDLREQMFKKLLKAPVQYYDSNTTGVIISRVFNDVSLVQSAATTVLTTLVRDSITAAVVIGSLISKSWKLSLFILVIAPLIALAIRGFSNRLRKISRLQQAANARVIEVLDEAAGNHRVVKVFGGIEAEGNRFRAAANHLRGLTMKFCAAASASSPFTQLIVACAVAVIMYYAVSSGEMTSTSELIGFVAAIGVLQRPLKNLSSVNEQLQRGLAGCESVFAMLDSASEPDTGTIEIKQSKGALIMKDVSLTYPGMERPAIDRLNLDIRCGETIALVGSSGSGKTSLVHLLPRFYLPTSGQIFLDDVPLNDITLHSLRDQISLVSQDIKLFNDTIANNIAYGSNASATRDEIIAAAKAAYANEFIEATPNGYDSQIGENGGRLSGGQRQRISIARAFLKNAPILLLDEATSALDSESERQVQAALETLMKGRTTIVVAHRLSTIERADRIIVMNEGRIIEQGSHQELLKRPGAYAALHAAQFSAAH